MRSTIRPPRLHDPALARPLGVVAALALAALALLATGCGKREAQAASGGSAPAVQVGAENIIIADTATLEAGPSLAGTLLPERMAAIRAQVGGTITRVLVEQGQAVSAGQLLLTIDDAQQRDLVSAARSLVRSAELQAEQAQRNAARLRTLKDAGAVAESAWETAQTQAQQALAGLDDAKARLVQAEKALAWTQVTAPFAGVVSERGVNLGDVAVAGPGASGTLVTVMDPTVLKLDAAVPAEALRRVRVGGQARFLVTGWDRPFTGTVSRINPTADPQTRQVRVYVTIPNRDRALVSGLFAQGRVATERAQGVALPESAVDTRGTQPSVLVLRQGKVARQPVTIGLTDEVAELVQVTQGVARGDTVLSGLTTNVLPGTPVQVRGSAATVSPLERAGGR
ncbi:MAG: efflux RND transporter periplasmic adaptor subunit [Gemmatimonadales bacterium]|nr:efflux RND transporter periplasmic adaptor subunit [Gemmatimonadales bacterium]